MSFHGFFNNKVSLGNLSSSSALHSVILSHPLLQPPPFQWWWERCLRSMLQTMLQTGLHSITNGIQGWGLAKKNAALGGTGASKPSFPRKENILWTASFNTANIAFLTWTWLHEPWKQLPEKCTVYKRDILRHYKGTKQYVHGLGECGKAEHWSVLFVSHGYGLGFMWGKNGGLVNNLIN